MNLKLLKIYFQNAMYSLDRQMGERGEKERQKKTYTEKYEIHMRKRVLHYMEDRNI
jgi:hypothetical protein